MLNEKAAHLRKLCHFSVGRLEEKHICDKNTCDFCITLPGKPFPRWGCSIGANQPRLFGDKYMLSKGNTQPKVFRGSSPASNLDTSW